MYRPIYEATTNSLGRIGCGGHGNTIGGWCEQDQYETDLEGVSFFSSDNVGVLDSKTHYIYQHQYKMIYGYFSCTTAVRDTSVRWR